MLCLFVEAGYWQIYPLLLDILNTCINTDCVPIDFKHAVVEPILKKCFIIIVLFYAVTVALQAPLTKFMLLNWPGKRGCKTGLTPQPAEQITPQLRKTTATSRDQGSTPAAPSSPTLASLLFEPIYLIPSFLNKQTPFFPSSLSSISSSSRCFSSS